VIDGTTTVAQTKEGSMRLSDETLRGRTVIGADGMAIGSVAELFVSSEWRVESIRIELRKEIADRIGANRTLFHRGMIELPVSFIQSVSDAVVLTINVEQLREAHRPPATDAPPPPT
jgi:sporulation protein YlmC with PRC-barrel domain